MLKYYFAHCMWSQVARFNTWGWSIKFSDIALMRETTCKMALTSNIMEGKGHLLKAPDTVYLDIKEEESCSADHSRKVIPTKLVTNVTISVKTTSPGKTVMSPKCLNVTDIN